MWTNHEVGWNVRRVEPTTGRSGSASSEPGGANDGDSKRLHSPKECRVGA
jgi:hypothetical protein